MVAKHCYGGQAHFFTLSWSFQSMPKALNAGPALLGVVAKQGRACVERLGLENKVQAEYHWG
jgi:hypothetical protein